jgi:hypothetical protein
MQGLVSLGFVIPMFLCMRAEVTRICFRQISVWYNVLSVVGWAATNIVAFGPLYPVGGSFVFVIICNMVLLCLVPLLDALPCRLRTRIAKGGSLTVAVYGMFTYVWNLTHAGDIYSKTSVPEVRIGGLVALSAFQFHLKCTAVITACAIHMFYRVYKNPDLAGLIDQPLPFAVLQMGGMLQVGTRVLHVLRGAGQVVAINESDQRQKPYTVAFESGETHQYSKESVTKLVILSKAREAANASCVIEVGMRVTHDQRGSGKCIEINLAEPRGKPYYIQYDSSGEVHHYSQDSVMKLRVLGKGAKVWHPTHGPGTLVDVNPADVRRRPYHVLFESGAAHKYSAESAMKLQVRRLLVPPPPRLLIVSASKPQLCPSDQTDTVVAHAETLSRAWSMRLPAEALDASPPIYATYDNGGVEQSTDGVAGGVHVDYPTSPARPKQAPPAAPRGQRKVRRVTVDALNGAADEAADSPREERDSAAAASSVAMEGAPLAAPRRRKPHVRRDSSLDDVVESPSSLDNGETQKLSWSVPESPMLQTAGEAPVFDANGAEGRPGSPLEPSPAGATSSTIQAVVRPLPATDEPSDVPRRRLHKSRMSSADDTDASGSRASVFSACEADGVEPDQKEVRAEVKAVWVPSAAGAASEGRVELRASPATIDESCDNDPLELGAGELSAQTPQALYSIEEFTKRLKQAGSFEALREKEPAFVENVKRRQQR